MSEVGAEGLIPFVLFVCACRNLSGNNLTGMLNQSVAFPSIQSMDVSNNQLTGNFPDVISDWHAIRALDFSRNLFRGRIPDLWTGLTNLVELNVSFNDLEGPIPREGAFLSLGSSSFGGNLDLCGSPLATACADSALCPSTTRHSHSTRRSRRLSASAIVAVSLAFFMTGLIALKRMVTRRLVRTLLHVYEPSPSSPGGRRAIAGKLVMFGTYLKEYHEDFSTGSRRLIADYSTLGSGSIGTVYRACLEGGKIVAVKKLSTLGCLTNQKDFERELDILGSVRHPNLVTLHGYYWSSSMQVLVSAYMDNGRLYEHLHTTPGELRLDWPSRLHIALGSARALCFLHQGCRPPILHLDVKSSNILLDGDMNPYLADFGLGKILPQTDPMACCRNFQSVRGYAAPELASQRQELTDKCDVYSFGVVLLELTTSLPPVLQPNQGTVVFLRDHVRAADERDEMAMCLDSSLVRGNARRITADMMAVLGLGLKSTAHLPGSRATMEEVVAVLEALRAVNDNLVRDGSSHSNLAGLTGLQASAGSSCLVEPYCG